MKFSTSSWHYRLWRFAGLYPDTFKTVCPYFWITLLLVGSIWIWIPHRLLANTKQLHDHFFTRVVLHILIVFGYIFALNAIYYDEKLMLYLGAMLILILSLVGLMALSEHIKDWRKERMKKRIAELESNNWKEPEKKPSAIKELVKGFKENYCPRMEFYDGEKK